MAVRVPVHSDVDWSEFRAKNTINQSIGLFSAFSLSPTGRSRSFLSIVKRIQIENVIKIIGLCARAVSSGSDIDI